MVLFAKTRSYEPKLCRLFALPWRWPVQGASSLRRRESSPMTYRDFFSHRTPLLIANCKQSIDF